MSPNEESSGGLWGIVGVAAAMAICCAGFPLVVGAGIAVGALGLAVGSVVVLAAGAGLVLWAWWRHRATNRCAPSAPRSGSSPEARAPTTDSTGGGEP